MNGIRQYFATLPKDGESGESVVANSAEEISQDREKSQKIVSNMESVIKSVRKRKSRKKRSTAGDGDISDISNILSCSLNLISPKKPPTTRSPECLNGNIPEVDLAVESVDVAAENEENIADGQKKNVFEVMMQSRGKISLTSTPHAAIPEKKRRFPEEFAQEEPTKKVKRLKKCPDAPTEKLPIKFSKKKKLFEMEVETVELPRKQKEAEVDQNGTFESEKEDQQKVPEKKKPARGKKNEKILEVEAVVVFASEPEIVEEEEPPNVRAKKKKKVKVIDSSSEEEIIPNGKLLRSRKCSQIAEEVIDTPQRRPQRSCRQKVLSYSVDVTFLDDISPEKPKGVKKPPREKQNEVIDVDSDSPRQPVKLAPIFVRPQKVEIDPEVLRAKQEFLMSGIPEKMRQTIEKQRAIEEEFELEQFPRISHVAQLECNPLAMEVTWRAEKINVTLRDEPPNDDCAQQYSEKSTVALIDKILGVSEQKKSIQGINFLTLNQQMAILREMKKNSGNFPAKKVFSFFRKRLETPGEPQVAIKSKKSSRRSSVEIIEDVDAIQTVLFTEKYRPERCEEFYINSGPATQLRDFLETFQSDTSHLNGTFESFTEDSSSCYTNSCCIVLVGPCGSGKSASVAAVATQLNFNVLEINAGMRRTGKRVLQELQEATQSHKVARGSQENTSQRFSLILVEDAEIAFEQDDGFIGAIHQIVADSKRPVILTTTQTNCAHLSRFMAMNVIHFAPPKPDCVAKWFTLMSLAEGIHIEESDVRDLYSYTGQDVRRTMMNIEFFARSGGDVEETGEKHIHRELNKSIKSTGLGRVSFDALWSNSGQWLLKEEATLEDFGELYDVISSCEVMSSRLEDDELTQCLLEGVVQQKKLPINAYDHFRKPRDVERSCLSSASSCQVAHLDYEPILRGICRSEQEKASRERRSSRFYHYLRQVVADASNELFERHCSIFA